MSEESIDFPVSVVLPAAGCGGRMGVSKPKQYHVILNRPLIVFAIDTFNRIPWIQHIVVTVSSQYIEYTRSLIQEYKFEKVIVAEGGTTRHRSIHSGLKSLGKVCKSTDVVVVLDAVRIFAEEDLLKKLVLAAKMHGAAGVLRPLLSTVIAVNSNNILKDSLDKNEYSASEMPQAFTYDIIKTAYDKATDYDFDSGTGCPLLAHKYTRTPAKMVDGPSTLMKVTYMKDLYTAEGMLKESYIKVRLIGCSENIEQDLRKAIEERRLKILDQISTVETMVDVTANSFVFNYDSVNPDLMKSNSLQCVPANHSSHYPLIDHVVLHLCRMNNTDGDPHKELVKLIQSLAVTMKDRHTLIYGILYSANQDTKFTSKMAASVLWNREPVLSGQVFFSDHSNVE